MDALNVDHTVMEVCGGQTHTILRWGLDQLLPANLRLIHGPGCPVCVTPAATIDQALQLAQRSEVILCTYGDMLRVPGSHAGVAPADLTAARAAGADVRVITAPLQALALARRQRERQVVLLAVGFETTAPATALLLQQAHQLGISNLSVLCAHVRVVPAMELVLAAPECRVGAVVAAGHVAAVMGTASLQQLVQRHRIPVVVGGFSPTLLLEALQCCAALLERGTPRLVNAYAQVVQDAGNAQALMLLDQVFVAADGDWRGFGCVPQGVLVLRPAYHHLDARRRFGLATPQDAAPSPADRCISAAVLQGRCRPSDCPSFGGACTPQTPLGAPMVSSEGACAAYYAYRRSRVAQ